MYRKEALEHHLRRHDERVLPRLVRPPVFRGLWLGCLLLLAAGALVAFARLPEYASGPAVVVAADAAGGKMTLVALLPAEMLPRLRAGQTVLLRTGEGARPRRSVVVAVEPAPLGPDAVRARWGAGAAAQLQAPAAVARVRFDAPPGEGAARHAGSVFLADVPVGWRRMVHFASRPGHG